jgi:biotin-dependent carboxylase-like uncharacterized protein
MNQLGSLIVVKPGLLTTVQDRGRWGFQSSGVPVAGPMDDVSHRIANELVGNDADAATLEVTLIGPDLIVDAETTMAVAGADFDIACDDRVVPTHRSFSVRRGQSVRFLRRLNGARAYLAVAGGVLTDLVLGSRSTHVLSAMGGVEGRPLKVGDRVPVLDRPEPAPPRRAIGLTLPSAGRVRLRVLPGPQQEWFGPDAFQTLTSTSFRVSPRSNRMGYRLEGPPLQWAIDREPVSEAVPMGGIQVPSSGAPILLMADRQTAGGYPKIATVISADLPLAGQAAPGDFIEFAACTWQESAAALIARERQFMRLARGGRATA